MDVEKKMEILRRNDPEIVTEKEMREVLTKKNPSAYIGYAPTGKIHIGYFVPVLKMKDFLDAGFKFTFMAADIHAHLDDMKSPWELLDARSEYYSECIKAMLKAIGAKTNKIKFVKGSDFEYDDKYVEGVLRLVAKTTLARAKRAAAEVVRFGEEPKMGGFVYPLMQAMDVPALKADVAFGGVDQRGTYMLARDMLPTIGYKKPVCLFTPLIPGLTGGKMSASIPSSKIDILDTPEVLKSKMNKAFCPAKEVENNGVLAFAKGIIFQLNNSVTIERPAKFGGNTTYDSYEKLEKDFVKGKIHPMDLKLTLANEVGKLLEPVRKHFKGKQKLLDQAYPK
ncbi:MAG: tyrosine--tRNA ligase [Candidatus Aenigmarchaeota archaeon]|nr:tyrosine--tRNA ligase [Candidatus Aenigmarchaeota archaeon]